MREYFAVSLVIAICAVCLISLAANRLVDVQVASIDELVDHSVRPLKSWSTPADFVRYWETKRTQLARPATPDDVALGNAVFTLAGLGRHHVWKTPECPMYATWIGLKQFPQGREDGTTYYDDTGYVVQAEELMVEGEWKRYFGFACEHGVAVVPGSKIDLGISADMIPKGAFPDGRLPGGVTWCTSPIYQRHDGRRVQHDNFVPGRPLFVDAYILNRRGAAMNMPTKFYRDTIDGPALVEGVSFELRYAPFKSTPGEKEFRKLEPKRHDHFSPTTARQTLDTMEWFHACTIDLSDWFDVERPGYYRFRFRFNPAALRLSEDATWSGSRITQEITVGIPPEPLTAEELNEKIPPFGGRYTERQLRDLIIKTVRPSLPSSSSSSSSSSSDATNDDKSLLPASRLAAFKRGPTTAERMFSANRKLIQSFDRYDPAGLLEELEQRLSAEKDRNMKLLIASLAAARGSSKGALFLLESMSTTDYETVQATHFALRRTLYGLEDDQPDWIVQLVVAALADQRYITPSDKEQSPGFLTISRHADSTAYLTFALGTVKCRKAVPFLIQMCRDTEGDTGAVTALGEIGDQRAIPVLIECLTRAANSGDYDKPNYVADRFFRPVESLANLKAEEAVPELLKHTAIPKVIGALATLGDMRAVAPLNQLVADGGRIVEGGKDVYPAQAKDRLIAATIALACLDKQNDVPRLCALLGDARFSAFDRREVVCRLGDRRDPRAIPSLVKTIKTDPSGSVVYHSITVLSDFRDKAAVDGLIECFDADFRGKQEFKRAYTPADFREHIAASLRTITGHNLGPDKKEWLEWWSMSPAVKDDLK